MKNVQLFITYLMLGMALICHPVRAQFSNTSFITTWQTDHPGTSTATQITIPTTGGGYNYTVDWVDVSNPSVTGSAGPFTGSATIDFAAAGTYQVSISGNFPRIYFNDSGDKEKILSIDQWGTQSWSSMQRAFSGCTHLVSVATDIPDLGRVKNTSQMFRNASSFTADLSGWAVGAVTNMYQMFRGATSFNSDLSAWNVSLVTNFAQMFYDASTFSADLGSWDVSRATNMGSMFRNASAFNANLGSWEVGNVTNMSQMFRKANSFAADLSNWNVGKVTNMSGMFRETALFNSALNEWDVSSVTRMDGMFYKAASFDQPLGNWEVGQVTNMATMFRQSPFNQDISTWDVSSVTNMIAMFRQASAFDQDLSSWQVSQVTDFRNMFYDVPNFNADLRDWDVGNATRMDAMFYKASSFDQDLSSWTVYQVTNLTNMLSHSGMSPYNYNLLLTGWGSTSLIPSGIVLGATGLSYCDQVARDRLVNEFGWDIRGDQLSTDGCQGGFDTDPNTFLTTWHVPGIAGFEDSQIIIPTAAGDWNYDYTVAWREKDNHVNNGVAGPFIGDATISFPAPGTYEVSISGGFPHIVFEGRDHAFKLQSVDQWGTQQWRSMASAFSGCENLVINATDRPDLSAVLDVSYMFQNARLVNSDMSHWDMSNVTNMQGMFSGAIAFNQDLGSWEVGNVTDMSSLFANATAFNGDITSWDTRSVANMGSMFSGAVSFNQDLGAWDVSNVTDMSYLFANVASFDQGLGSWNVSMVTDMHGMFSGATSFNQDLGGWQVGSVSNMAEMFKGASSFNQGLGGWDVSGVASMNAMFSDATAFNQDLGDWHLSSINDLEHFFDYSGLSVVNYRSTLVGWSSQSNIPNDIRLGAKGLYFCYGLEGGRRTLVEQHQWTVIGDLFTGDSCELFPVENLVGTRTDNNGEVVLTWDFPSSLELPDPAAIDGIPRMAFLYYEIYRSGNPGDGFGYVGQAFPHTTSWSDGSVSQGQAYYYYLKMVRSGESGPHSDTLQVDPVPTPFVTTWRSDDPGESANNQILIPTASDVWLYNYEVQWKEEGNEENTGTAGPFTGDALITFPTAGTYQIQITGDFPQIIFADGGDKLKLKSVNRWGNQQWKSMESAFAGCLNLVIHATDVPNLSSVADVSWMFENAASMNAPIGNWDMGNVTNMQGMLSGAVAFNQDIGPWDVGNVTNMASLFAHATAFDQDLSAWHVHSVTDMQAMFSGASAFSQSLGSWEVSNVSDMAFMLDNSALSVTQYESTLQGWAGLPSLMSNVTLGAAQLAYCDDSIRNGLVTQYNWAIVGDGTGGGCSVEAATGLALSESDGVVQLSWTDAADNEIAYQVERAEQGLGGFERIASLDSNTTTYQDQPPYHTTYLYRVQAVATDATAYSETDSITLVAVTNPDPVAVNEDMEQRPSYNGNISAMRWKGGNDQEEQLFTFQYDMLNRLKKAQHANQQNGSFSQDRGNYSVPGIDYDLNGNILQLTRQGQTADGLQDVIDVLHYDYGRKGNQLQAVRDSRGTAGFNDGNTTSQDYAYDANGNMITDRNKDIERIEYNHLNLPIKVVFAEEEGIQDSITYLYDAAGIKLQQKVYEGGALKKATDYIAGHIYQTDSAGDRKLRLIQHDEGRIVPNDPGLDPGFDYQYHLKDHLGNVRLTFSTTPENYETVATMESAEEGEAFSHYNPVPDALVAHSGTHVSRNSNLVNGGLGLNTLMSVNQRDTIRLSAYAHYHDTRGTFNIAAGVFSSALLGAFGGGAGLEGSQVQNGFDQAFAGGTALADKSGSSDAPGAYINYILFDRDMNYLTAGFQQISGASNGSTVAVEMPDIYVEEDGYLVAFLSNETHGAEVVVSWDDFRVYHGKTNVVSTSDYYPFGLAFNEKERTGGVENFMNTFQDQEYEEETGWVKFKWRNHQPEIGRFFNVDPLSHDYVYNSPYGFQENKLGRGRELEGLELFRPTSYAKYLALIGKARASGRANRDAVAREISGSQGVSSTYGVTDGANSSRYSLGGKQLSTLNNANEVSENIKETTVTLTNEVSKDGIALASAVGTAMSFFPATAPVGSAIKKVATVMDEARQVALEGKSGQDVLEDGIVRVLVGKSLKKVKGSIKSSMENVSRSKITETSSTLIDIQMFIIQQFSKGLIREANQNSSNRNDSSDSDNTSSQQ